MWIRRLIVFFGALLLYIICLDRGASLWDCPEYILGAWKLEIGHPPGNPTWQLTANVVSHLGGSAVHAAVIINALSAVAMALATAFLSEIAYLLLRASLFRGNRSNFFFWANLCAASGALCYGWCDSAIFSAVEAEVYALSAFVTALMLWLALLWAKKRRRGEIAASRRVLILTAYIAGLGVGVHELNFLILPALALVYFYGARSYPVDPQSRSYRLAVVRTDSLPTALWSLLMFVVGTTTYLLIPIRAAANPPVNQGNPSNLERFISYYTREQYGSKPLLYGPTPYSAPLYQEEYDSVSGTYRYSKYHIVTDRKGRKHNVYADELNMWFPRMTSRDTADISFYEAWAGMVPEKMVPVEAAQAVDSAGNKVGKVDIFTGEREMRHTFRPTYFQQARYLLGYQIGYMYMRYLLWNYMGRQNNVHSGGGPLTGNFITGVPAIDDAMLGPQDKLHPSLRSENPGYNRYFMIPFIFGLLGICVLIAQGKAGRRVCAIIALFFLFTGLLIVVYLNQDPGEPRERDYSFLGSYMAFAIWIACGLAGMVRLMLKARGRRWLQACARGAAVLLCVGLPLQILSQTYDDHNRSRRPGAKERAESLLADVEPEAIVIVYGDNLIFPLWYAQEVLSMRPDVTVVALPYLTTDWYREQLRIPGPQSKPLRIDEPTPSFSGVEEVVENIVDLNGDSRPVYRSDSKAKLNLISHPKQFED